MKKFWIAIVLLAAAGAAAYFFFGKKETAPAGRATKNAPTEQYVKTSDPYKFDDGLKNPDPIRNYDLDENGEGLAQVRFYNVEINGDRGRIIRSQYENGTAHFYYDYKIELNGADIAPAEGLRTIEGAECNLQKIRFVFAPKFQVIKISRPWHDTWTTPTMATETIYELHGDALQPISHRQLSIVCNVMDLF